MDTPDEIPTREEVDLHNANMVETNVRLLGDRTIIAEIVQLLAYIRNGLKNNQKTVINVHLMQTVADPVFTFDVNGMQVPDLVLNKDIQVN